MKAIEFETTFEKNGCIYIPKTLQHTYGKFAKFVILLPEDGESKRKKRRPGSAKGILQVLEEDNAHLDDFKEYMP